ncbi:GTP 3',8-cyclase MoaA [Thermosphaera aggregans]|uniref:Radical SAM domain protein n=1 Tax=Thermosphaera aggregans (strain DSM 11486 / M11TL) TaxID=633148 RepID=D5U186_THEAM|nr:GTP 3',8-cyclase MoaA [Thermosphaera aggregans]ADG90886.1 Radical SAM domain protein [Thermosphaera aggregans DSM 11486]
MLRDGFGREVDSFRIVVTMRCNYNCIFCHREGLTGLDRAEVLTPDDYRYLAYVSRKLGIVYFKITGGEPLLRRDTPDIIKGVREYSKEVSLTTNGYFLKNLAGKLADAGLDRLNVSVHSLNDEVYQAITRTRGSVKLILEGIEQALEHGIKVKLNFLAMKINLGEFEKIIEYASSKGVDVNVIELIPLGTPHHVYLEQRTSLDPIIEKLHRISSNITISNFQNRPIYTLPSGIKVNVIKGYGNPDLCARCTRLRLTPEGWIKTCIFLEEPFVDISKELKNKDEYGVVEKIKKAVSIRKPYFTRGRS